MLRWKRKGGRATAEAAGMAFRVGDDGAYAYRTAAGAWVHGRGATRGDAMQSCEAVAREAEGGALLAQHERGLRKLAAEHRAACKRVVTDAERRWAHGVAFVLASWVHEPLLRAEIEARLAGTGGAMRILVEDWTADADVVAGLQQMTQAEACAHVERLIVDIMVNDRLGIAK
jgi:hypothetical protein